MPATYCTMPSQALPPGSLPFAPGPMVTRRQWLAQQMPWGLAAVGAAGWLPPAAHALPARTLVFPRDHGSHPELRTEWWYITGHVQAQGQPWGFQITFFRSRVDGTQQLQSAFAAKHLLFAHAAITDVRGQRLLHDQRIARAGFGVAQASEADTRIRLQDWTLERSDTARGKPDFATSRYTTRIVGSGFGLDLVFDSTQPVLLQGQQGLSRKGPDAEQASYYYSQPQLAVSGTLQVGNKRMAVTPDTGRAWMDHEWSEALLHPDAQGWDWIGMNLHDGSALTAFRLRRADGTALWEGGSWRAPGQPVQVFGAQSVAFTPLRWWTSPRSGARYPVQWQVQTPAGTFAVNALLDSQELDSSGSTGAIYWEGLSDLMGATGQPVGRGYLEMTGYAKPLRL
ncbi:putative secreted hydrolase [Acidovorax delafieldii]|nr:carotenoid 1,2-hydratase [Acidovorax delafieldii]MDR6152641.1 putative secreted hydrolase [Acidovorax delafieldii]